MILPNGAIVAVLDGQHLRLFRNMGHEPAINLVALPRPDLDQLHAGSGGRHHSTPANPDVSRLIEDDFIAAAGAFLNRLAIEKSIQSLVIIADPRSLGELRQHLHPMHLKKLTGEIAKDLSQCSPSEIRAAIVNA